MSEPRKSVCCKLGRAFVKAIRELEAESQISAAELAISVAGFMNMQMDEYSINGKNRELFIEMFNDMLNTLPNEKEN